MQTEETPTYTDVTDIPFLAVAFPRYKETTAG